MNLLHIRHRLRGFMTLNNGVLLVALLIAATWVWSTIGAIQRNFQLQQQVDALAQEVAVIELENKTQELQKKYYESDEYLELSARERLDKAAPGEKVVLLPPNTVKPTPANQPDNPQTAAQDRSNFSQWMYFLFGTKGAG